VVASALLLATLSLPPAAAGGGGVYQRVLAAYERDGSVPPCQFSSVQLETALKGVDTYGAQYFADFTDAVLSALAQRASGACSPARGRSGGRSPAVAGSAASGGALPGSPTAAGDAGLPGPIVLMGLLALVAVVSVLLWRLAATLGWEPAWTSTWRHGLAESAFRLTGRLQWLDEWLGDLWRRGKTRRRAAR